MCLFIVNNYGIESDWGSYNIRILSLTLTSGSITFDYCSQCKNWIQYTEHSTIIVAALESDTTTYWVQYEHEHRSQYPHK